MLLIGSQAALIHFEDFRQPLDWDVVATPAEVTALRGRLPELPPGQTTLRFSLQGRRLEVTLREGQELWELAEERCATCVRGRVNIPGLGEVDVASPGLLMAVKLSLVAYPVQFYKNLADFSFLRSRVEPTEELVPVLHAAMAEAAKLHTETVPPVELSCSHRSEVTNDWAAHDAWHERLKLGAVPRCAEPDAWEGMVSVEASERGRALCELVAEEALVLAAERRERCRPDDAADPHWHRWALRRLMTGELPLRLRYFAANHYDEIEALVSPNAGGAGRGVASCTRD